MGDHQSGQRRPGQQFGQKDQQQQGGLKPGQAGTAPNQGGRQQGGPPKDRQQQS